MVATFAVDFEFEATESLEESGTVDVIGETGIFVTSVTAQSK